MRIWLPRLAWLADLVVVALPLLARWVDPPPPPLQKPSGPAELPLLLLDIVSRAGKRAWMPPVILGLAIFVLLCGALHFFLEVRLGTPWPQRWAVAWPLLGLIGSILLAALLDQYLPEFK